MPLPISARGSPNGIQHYLSMPMILPVGTLTYQLPFTTYTPYLRPSLTIHRNMGLKMPLPVAIRAIVYGSMKGLIQLMGCIWSSPLIWRISWEILARQYQPIRRPRVPVEQRGYWVWTFPLWELYWPPVDCLFSGREGGAEKKDSFGPSHKLERRNLDRMLQAVYTVLYCRFYGKSCIDNYLQAAIKYKRQSAHMFWSRSSNGKFLRSNSSVDSNRHVLYSKLQVTASRSSRTEHWNLSQGKFPSRPFEIRWERGRTTAERVGDVGVKI